MGEVDGELERTTDGEDGELEIVNGEENGVIEERKEKEYVTKGREDIEILEGSTG